MEKIKPSADNSPDGVNITFWIAALYTTFILAISIPQLITNWRVFFRLGHESTTAFTAVTVAVIVIQWYFSEHRLMVRIVKSHPELAEQLSVASIKRLVLLVMILSLIHEVERFL